jgi:hypothetical protein
VETRIKNLEHFNDFIKEKVIDISSLEEEYERIRNKLNTISV